MRHIFPLILPSKVWAKAFEDDKIPYISLGTTTEIWAEAFGCRVFYPPNNNPMAIHMVDSAKEAEKITVPNIEDTRLWHILETARVLRQEFGPQTLFGLPDMQSPMDVAAQIWDKTDFFASMYEEPDTVKELGMKIQRFIMAFMDLWKQYVGEPLIAHHPAYYMPEGVSFSVDEMGNVSQEMFEEFFLKELNDFSQRYGGIGIHCCANSEHQWKNLLKIQHLKMLNLYQPEDVMIRSYSFFAQHTAQWPGGLKDGVPFDLPVLEPQAYPPGTRMVLNFYAKDLEEAKRLSHQLMPLYHEKEIS